MSDATVSVPWDDVRAAVVDLRGWEPPDLVGGLVDVEDAVMGAFRSFGPEAPAAVVVRHVPAPSHRVSGGQASEMALCACRGLVRQLRYDRSWSAVPLVFVDARDAPDDEVRPVVVAALGGRSRIDLDRSSGATAAFGWERGDQP